MKTIDCRCISATAVSVVLVAAILCEGKLQAASINAGDWSTYQHDNAHTGRSPADFSPAQLQKLWGSTQYRRPIVVGNSIYGIGTYSSSAMSLASLNLYSGQLNWSSTIPGASGGLAYADDMIVVSARSTTSTKLYVYDAASGTQKYAVDLPSFQSPTSPTVLRNSNNQLVAYVADGGRISAVNLGSSTGSILWTTQGKFGGASTPTIAENSIILAGPGDYYAIDQLTGVANHFFNGGIIGGGGITAAFDADRRQIYIRNDLLNHMIAFSFESNAVITQKWQTTDTGSGSVSIGDSGRIYSTDRHTIWEQDPSDGHVIRSINGLDLPIGFTPVLSSNSLFYYGGTRATEIFDLNTFTHTRTLPDGRGSTNTHLQSPGAIFDNGYVLYHSNGFDVYVIPEPSIAILAIGLAVILAIRNRSYRVGGRT